VLELENSGQEFHGFADHFIDNNSKGTLLQDRKFTTIVIYNFGNLQD